MLRILDRSQDRRAAPAAGQRPLRLVAIPNRPWRAVLAGFVPGSGPDLGLEPKELRSHGITCRIIDPHGFPYNPLAGRGTFYAGFDPLRALRVLLFERDADAIFCWYESGMFLLALLKPLFRFRPRLIMVDLPARSWRTRAFVLDRVVPRLDGLLVLTRHSKAEADTAYRLKREAALVGFCVDDGFFSPRPGPDDAPDDGYVLCVGDDAGRDWPTLLAACARFRHPVRLRTSARLPAAPPPNVSVLGRTSFAGLRELYARARVVVVPLRPIASPSGITTVLEAMAMGRPVVVTDIGTTRDIVTHGRDGLAVPAGDAEALAAAIDTLMADAGLRDRLGRAARDTIERDFTPAVHYARMATAIRTIVDG